jgi:hypothetical protein
MYRECVCPSLYLITNITKAYNDFAACAVVRGVDGAKIVEIVIPLRVRSRAAEDAKGRVASTFARKVVFGVSRDASRQVCRSHSAGNLYSSSIR